MTVLKFGQGMTSMNSPTKELARLVADRKLRHDGNPVVRWMLGNLMVEGDAADNVKPSKKVNSSAPAFRETGVQYLCHDHPSQSRAD